MSDPITEQHLSELVDGELDRERANGVLLAALDDLQAREQLKTLLRLRRSFAAWRQQSLPVSPATPMPQARSSRLGGLRLAASLGAAAVIGGLLVMGGFLVAQQDGARESPSGVSSPWTVALPSPDVVRQAANVFALHESVAGPLKWYAADDASIQVAALDPTHTPGAPIALFIDLMPARRSSTPRRYMVICRDREQAAMDFPAQEEDSPAARIHLLPRITDGVVDVRYAVSVSDLGLQPADWASLAGRRSVSTERMDLGRIALAGREVQIGITARILPTGESG